MAVGRVGAVAVPDGQTRLARRMLTTLEQSSSVHLLHLPICGWKAFVITIYRLRFCSSLSAFSVRSGRVLFHCFLQPLV